MGEDEIMKEPNLIKFTEKEIKKLFIFYLTCFILSILSFIVCLYFTFFSPRISSLVISGFLLISISSLVGSFMYYIRKLYKFCIQNTVVSNNVNDNIQKIGAKIYFYVRPLFAFTLSHIFFLGIILGTYIISPLDDSMSKNFSVLCGFIGFFIGYNNGKIISDLDKKSAELIEKIAS